MKLSKNDTKPKSLTDAKIEVSKLMARLLEVLGKNKCLLRLQTNYTLGEGFEFKAIVDSQTENEKCRMLLIQYHYDTEEGQLMPTHKTIFKTGDENDNGWTESYVAFNKLKSIVHNFKK